MCSELNHCNTRIAARAVPLRRQAHATIETATQPHTTLRDPAESSDIESRGDGAAPRPAANPIRCATMSVFSPDIPVNASNAIAAKIGATLRRQSIAR